MQADLPFYECPEDALRAAVQALGGAKKVGALLWPDRTIDAAARLLLDCLNPSRPEKLELTQAMRIFSLARDAGYNAPFQWFAADAGYNAPFQWFAAEVGYDARPVTKAEEVDRLTAVIESSTRTLSAALATMERMQRARAA